MMVYCFIKHNGQLLTRGAGRTRGLASTAAILALPDRHGEVCFSDCQVLFFRSIV